MPDTREVPEKYRHLFADYDEYLDAMMEYRKPEYYEEEKEEEDGECT